MRWFRLQQSSGPRVALPHPIRWALLTAALIVAAGAVLTFGPPPHIVGMMPSWIGTLPTWLTVPAIVKPREWIAAGLLILSVFTLRRCLFARLARRPGPVEIASFDGPPKPPSIPDEPDEAPTVPTHDILADFRHTLAEMTMPVPQSIPSEPQADNVLDDVRTAGEKSGNAIATIATLLQAMVRVRHAYRVSAQVRVRPGPEPCGITVHVVALPSGRGEMTTLWSDNWTDLAQQAAHVVGAFVLPRSRLANRPPWTAWHGREVPPELFHLAQLASSYRRQRRYEEAVDALHRAIKLDPQNPYLRIELAQVQEQLGLHMDALASYADILAIEAWYDRPLWRRLRVLLHDNSTGGPPPRGSRSRRDRAAVLIAHYRLVARLVSATELSSQWKRSLPPLKNGDLDLRRSITRQALRERLTIWLKSYYRLYSKEYNEAIEFERFSEDESSMSHFFRFVGYCELQHLVRHYAWLRGRRRPGLPVTQTALNIMRVWAPIQLQRSAACKPGKERPSIPSNVDDVDLQLWRYLRRKPAFMRTWQEYYNAACAIAVAVPGRKAFDDAAHTTSPQQVGGNRIAADPIDRYALFAIRYLERAVSCTHSGSVSQYQQWLSTGDEDLNAIRPTRYFIDFLERYFPNERSRTPRPEHLIQLVMSFHSIRLLRRYARLRADFWSTRLDAPKAEDTLAELQQEPSIRNMALDFAENNRDWISRLKLIQEAHSFVQRRSLRIFDSSLPSFQDDPSADPETLHNENGVSTSISSGSYQQINKWFEDARRDRDEVWPQVIEKIKSGHGNSRADQAVGTGDPSACERYWADLAAKLTTILKESDHAK